MRHSTLECFLSGQDNLSELLKDRNICPQTIQNIIDGGYYVVEAAGLRLLDRYYGEYSCSIPIDAVSNDGFHIDTYPNREIPIVDVASVTEAQEYIDSKYSEMSPEIKERIVFRGQNTSYYTQRIYVNPWVRLRNGKEPSLVPSYWRKNAKSLIIDEPVNLLKSVYADSLIYDGIDTIGLVKQNYEKYGIYTISELADYNDPISKEYYRRWMINKTMAPDLALLAQHYGLATTCLDVTFDLHVAFFFAAYQYRMLENGKATYSYNPNDESVVYCLLYTDSSLKASRDMVEKISSFDHLTPVRPIEQHCALVHHHALDINGSAGHILMGFRMKDNFDVSDIPEPEKLFPPPSKDLFYARLLDMKYNSSCIELWQDVVEYDFLDC